MNSYDSNYTPSDEEYARRLEARDEILYLKEAAIFVRKPDGTMRYYRHLGIGPRSFRHGRHVAYWKSDLVLWLIEESRRPDGRDDSSHGHARPQASRSRTTKSRDREAS
ncbi:MAG: hypothetical protein QOI06_30 [Nocardioidaceae bacterium]|nr:hypothetical protein [Nocardioidaceae bacterium]